MKLYSVGFLIVCGLLYSAIVQVQGYVQCGQKLCHGASAQCCTWDKTQCCWLSWYTMWWVWVGGIILVAIVCSIVICCCTKRRRSASVRHLIVAPPLNHSGYYGSIPPTPSTTLQPYTTYNMESKSGPTAYSTLKGF